MNFLRKNKKIINILYVISILVDFSIAYVINKISQDSFSLTSTKNITILLVFISLTIIYIICQILVRFDGEKRGNRKLQKVFLENGGYEAIVEEMKDCLKKHDYKNFKALKKAADMVEK